MVAPSIVDERPARERQLLRFLLFGLAVLIGVSGLTARLVYLQFDRGQVYQARAEQNRTVKQAIPSTRGLIYDRTVDSSSSTSRATRSRSDRPTSRSPGATRS